MLVPTNFVFVYLYKKESRRTYYTSNNKNCVLPLCLTMWGIGEISFIVLVYSRKGSYFLARNSKGS